MPLATHTVKTFPTPLSGGAIDPNVVRGNDNTLRTAFNAHDADASIHVQSGTLANRPVTSVEGATYFCTDTQDTYSYTGGVWVQSAWAHWYGTFWSGTDQTAAATNTGYVVTYGTTGLTRGVTLVDSSKVKVGYAGDYNVQFSVQLANDDSQDQDVWLWLKKNGTNVADSGGRVSVTSKHGSTKGHYIAIWNVFLTLAANDYVQLFWETTSTLVSIEHLDAAGDHPAAPSAIITINRV